jgi:hypothetical protein
MIIISNQLPSHRLRQGDFAKIFDQRSSRSQNSIHSLSLFFAGLLVLPINLQKKNNETKLFIIYLNINNKKMNSNLQFWK